MSHFHSLYRQLKNKFQKSNLFKPISFLLLFSIPSVLVTFFLLEIFVRIFLPVSDAPDIYFDPNLGNIFVPNQKGVFVKGKSSEIKAKYNINNKGWNSPYDYGYEKPTDTIRIAVIGDSYIEALQVDYDKSYPYLLENLLNKNDNHGKKVQVYTFGHSGANLFHYQSILTEVVKKYNPNFVIINIVLNDFDESFYGLSRKDNWSLIYEDSKFKKVFPKEVSNLPLKKFLRHSAIVRYLTINLDLVNTSPIFNKLFYAETRNYNKNETPKQIDKKTIALLIRFVLENINKENKQNNIKTILILDTDKKKVYENNYTFKNFYISETKNIAQQLGIPILNLEEVFEKDWKNNHMRFNFEFDEHWNEYGHKTIANALFEFLDKRNLYLKIFESN